MRPLSNGMMSLKGLCRPAGVGSVLLATLLAWLPVAADEQQDLARRLATERAGWMAWRRATILHVLASQNSHNDWSLVISELVENGEDPNARDREGWTPLHYTAIFDTPKIIDALVVAGATVDLVDSAGRTPLHFAAVNGRALVTKALIRVGADVNADENLEGVSPLHMAASSGYPDIVKALLHGGAEVNSRTTDGETPLHAAASAGHVDTIKEGPR